MQQTALLLQRFNIAPIQPFRPERKKPAASERQRVIWCWMKGRTSRSASERQGMELVPHQNNIQKIIPRLERPCCLTIWPGEINVRKIGIFASVAAAFAAGCTNTGGSPNTDITAMNTVTLCHVLTVSTDEQYRVRVAALLVKRGATAEKCMRLVQADNAVATGIAVAAVGGAAVAVAANNGGGGYYPPPSAYGVAWDQFYGANYSVIWRCRDKATGRFVDDYYCASAPMIDSTWPGWSA
ncbi:hypothetical protein FJV76_24990 [Mesorhizobium sp. WSM4303]|uniref:hypothetical protein n=1 Tax=unclassified Mesorhizobium TaxID=325217 RepID=UPI00115EE08E|nr:MULTISPECIES: hypothetical protein [unclassified Mesorhizobium]TRC98416.1 hypothetical protein FJV77_08210 [Mesorhizobium sp. WSM4306]TRC99046.1 hypothetical protein FJV76_24990 [Mesorhizobium sp. WSM4303]